MIIVGFILGIVNWFINLYKLCCTSKSNRCFDLWSKATNRLATTFSFVKIFFIYMCVGYLDRYEYSVLIMTHNECSDEITNGCFKHTGTTLYNSRNDNMFVFKLTMLMLTFEVINYLTPKIVHIRKYQSYTFKID